MGAALLLGLQLPVSAQVEHLPPPEFVLDDAVPEAVAPAPAGPAAQGTIELDAPLSELDRGIASWYGPGFQGRRTASGERFDMHALTAAHPSLPFGTVVRVESVATGRSVDVRINDRGPHIKRRIIDLSRAAANALGLLEAGRGIHSVVLKILKPPPQQ
jgi:rare lipoprotein A